VSIAKSPACAGVRASITPAGEFIRHRQEIRSIGALVRLELGAGGSQHGGNATEPELRKARSSFRNFIR